MRLQLLLLLILLAGCTSQGPAPSGQSSARAQAIPTARMTTEPTPDRRIATTQARQTATAEAIEWKAEATREAAERPALVLLKGHGCTRTAGSYMQYEGQVRNISGQSLRNVQAVVTYTAADGTFVTSDQALLTYNPILDGQTSPFRVTTRFNPAITQCGVDFKFLGRETIHFITE